MAIRISKTSKLEGVFSWSLIARATCPGSIDDNGELVPVCAGCYAVGGNYRYPNVKAPREENREDWKRDGWVADMVAAMANMRYFRWFDSGDSYALALVKKIRQVITLTPWVAHWFPSKMYKFAKFAAEFAAIRALPNVALRFSADTVDGTFTAGLHGSCVLPPANPGDKSSAAALVPAGVTECKAPSRGGKCGPCRACYDPTVPVIGYVAHGKPLLKQMRVASANLIAVTQVAA